MSEPNPNPNPPHAVPQLPADVMQSLQNLVARSGGSDRASELLFNDNKTLRDEIRDLKKQLPKEGAVVLSQADADELASYRAYGKPDELKTKLDEGETAKQEAAKAAHERKIAKLASAKGLQNNALLQTLLRDVDFDVTGEGESQSVIVKAGGKDLPFDEYTKSRPDLEAALPALQAQATPPRGGSFVRQGVNGGAPVSEFDRIRQQAKTKQEATAPSRSWMEQAGVARN